VGQKGPVLGPWCIGPEKGSNPYFILFYPILFYSPNHRILSEHHVIVTHCALVIPHMVGTCFTLQSAPLLQRLPCAEQTKSYFPPPPNSWYTVKPLWNILCFDVFSLGSDMIFDIHFWHTVSNQDEFLSVFYFNIMFVLISVKPGRVNTYFDFILRLINQEWCDHTLSSWCGNSHYMQ